MRRFCLVLLLCLAAAGCQSAPSPLRDYVNATDGAFRWSVQSKESGSEMRSAVLSVTSQKWQGSPWRHQVEVVCPETPRQPANAPLIVTAGKPGDSESMVERLVAQRAGCPAVVVYGIPNQPLFGDLREDALIAHTFKKTLETKDSTWPLLLPMTKGVVRSMDAVQEFAKREWSLDIRGFVVTGASKRGWTAWLVAAADPKRVKAIVPVVYDNLNMAAQMAHQQKCYGSYSEKINDYTSLKLQEVLSTPEGKALAAIVDPWEYREALLLPKIIVNGANDPYWVLDSLNIYWPDLKGRNYVMYFANGGHDLGMKGLEALPRAMRLAGAYEAVIGALNGGSFPSLSWKYSTENGEQVLNVQAPEVKGGSALLWTASSSTRDFRQSTWTSSPMQRTASGWTGSSALPKSGYAAVFADVPVAFGRETVTLSTQVQVAGPAGAAKR